MASKDFCSEFKFWTKKHGLYITFIELIVAILEQLEVDAPLRATFMAKKRQSSPSFVRAAIHDTVPRSGPRCRKKKKVSFEGINNQN